MQPLYLKSLRGGINLTDPPDFLDDDQTTVAENVDFDTAPLGAKRQGCVAVVFSGLNLSGNAATFSQIVGLHRFLPTDDAGDAELVVEGLVPSGIYGEGTPGNLYWSIKPEGPTTLFGAQVDAYKPANTQNLHGKMFITIPVSNVSGGSIDDRLYVYDPDTTGLTILNSSGGSTTFDAIRKVGVWEPGPPASVTDSGSGSFATTRYYRIRGVIQVDGVTKYRSEPSTSVQFDPSGSGSAAVVTRPTFMEGTHWELEESLDDVLFYLIATTVITTTTYTDTTPAANVDLENTLGLSEDIGDYTVPYAPAYLAADEDRLILGGSLYQDQLRSRVSWTPVWGASGVGNDERLEDDTDPFVDLDGFDGGPITALGGPVNGFLWALKDSHIYKLVRTGARQQSYIATPVTKANGAIPHSLVSGLDETGNVALYFLDPRIGPMVIGTKGLKTLGEDIREGIWLDRFNENALFPCHGLFYASRQQLWWWIAVDDNDTPNLKIVVDVKEFSEDRRGYRRGWGTHTGKHQECMTSVLFADNLRTVASGEAFTDRLKPYFGTLNPVGVLGATTYAQAVGSYTGNGTTQNITGLAWTPTVVMVAPYNPTASISSNFRGGFVRTPQMTGSNSLVRAAQPQILTTGITSMNADGFTVGSHDGVNKSGIEYYYVAFYDADGDYMRTGSYTGAGGAGQTVTISGTEFSPSHMLWVIGTSGAASANGVLRTSGMVGDYSVKLNSSTQLTNQITSVTASGFTVGSEASVNSSGSTMYYVGWKDDASNRLQAMLKVGKYTGTGGALSVSGVGFRPDHLWVSGPTIYGGVWKTPDL